jgi:DNA-binding GntR family transcriptional regulator
VSNRRGRGRLTDHAYGYVRDGILRGAFPVGSVLAEEEIAAALGTSRTPVRQALGLLLQEGLVEVGARLPILYRMLGQLRGFVRVVRLGSARPPEVLAQVVSEHEEIVDALERRNAQTALAALREHLYRSDYAIAERVGTR